MLDAIKKHAGGFTLVETMMVVALIAIVTAIAIPAWQSMKRNSDLKSAAYEIMSSVQWAKSEAARRNACVGINFIPAACPTGQSNCYELFGDDNCNRVVDGAEQNLRAGSLGSKARMTTTFPNNAIAITPRSLLRTGGVLPNGHVSLRPLSGSDLCYNLAISASAGLRLNTGHWVDEPGAGQANCQ